MAMTGRTANLCQSDEGGEVGGVCVPTIGCATGETCQTLVRAGYGVYLASASGLSCLPMEMQIMSMTTERRFRECLYTTAQCGDSECGSVRPVALIFEPPRAEFLFRQPRRVFSSPFGIA